MNKPLKQLNKMFFFKRVSLHHLGKLVSLFAFILNGQQTKGPTY